MESKKCKSCESIQDVTNFYRRKIGSYVTMCKSCYKKNMALRRSLVSHKEPLAKTCSICQKIVSIEEFHKNSASAGGRLTFCKKCSYKKNLKIKYKISNIEELLSSVGNKCEICESEFDYLTRNTTPNIDHDHSCCPTDYTCGNCVRGVLCISCNNAIGLLRDSKKNVKSALNYLSK